ncbi:MAG: type IV pili twitching motility protein PilT [Halobacteriovoraceae bacterium]|nr:type IV pili twitching motility protein PilT [Halobacteriovoraceae bacterium]|tara:strand:- start:56000 stop:57088 length:1089 start_codon:yes stop_codon:yes gene_type:complete
MGFSKQNLVSLLKVAVENKASDVHIRTGERPCFRIFGDLVEIQTKPFDKEDVSDIAKLILPTEKLRGQVASIKEFDGGFAIQNLCRIRFNLYKYDKKIGIIFRIIKDNIPTFKDLGLPSILGKIAEQRRGLILVAGPTGSGKSTTLAAMINHINESRPCHIVTIEDPIEYLHDQKKARISQREVGLDTIDFPSALRSALRQDPDVILIGEMRDPETIQIALKAAETGHTVFSTVHTTNTIATIGRIISMFPPEEQKDVRERLSVNLHACVSQRMLKRTDQSGVVIAQEIMVTTPGIKEAIEGDVPLERIREVIEEGFGPGGNGSQSFDQHVMWLFENGIISKKTALDTVSSQSDFIQSLTFD